MFSMPFIDRGRSNLHIRLGCMLVSVAMGIQSTMAADSLRQEPVKSPISADDSLAQFHLHPKLKIELVASEPEVVDPVAIAFDADGRMWVVEMRDYPNGPAKERPPKSRIKILEDTDGDGRFEKVTIFADQLLFATGLQPWKGGVIVTLAGDVYWMKDTNNDGKADVREHWFTGFKQDNPQLRANHPTFAYDNHIYLSSGIRGGSVIAVKEEWKKDAKPVSVSGRDFRFDPLTGKYEAISGNGQFGMTFDDFGNRFVCSNRNPCMHVVLEDRYIRRNPHLAVKSVVHDVSPAGADSRIYPISKFWTTSTLHEGQFTAACGVTIYRGDLLPNAFAGNSFTCDPTGNLVHRDVLIPMGATFTSKPGREKIEFLATRDEWCRPVNLSNGPDGALYVVDMYRAVIEHPQYMPDELKKRPDLNLGNDLGRIYRIVPSDKKKQRRSYQPLARVSSGTLAGLLAHPNAWHRETAQRLLIERQDKSAVEQLEQMASKNSDSITTTPPGRIHALWALKGLASLSMASNHRARLDNSPRVREHALRLAEPWIRDGKLKITTGAKGTQDARQRFQLVLTLGEARSDVDLSVLEDIMWNGKSDPWTRLAFFSSIPATPITDEELMPMLLMTTLSAKLGRSPPGTHEFYRELFTLIGSRNDELELARVFVLVVPSNMAPSEARLNLECLVGLCRGLARRGKKIKPYAASSIGSWQASTFEIAARVAESPDNDEKYRLLAIEALRFANSDRAAQSLLKLATSESNQKIQLAAIGSVAAFNKPEIGPTLLRDFPSATPVVRRSILDVMLRNAGRTKLLLDEIEAKRIAVPELGASNVNRLSKHRDQRIRQRALKLLADAIPAERQKVLKDYQSALTLKADPKHGREIFRKNCAACHRIDNIGVDVAPDIADSRSKKPEQLLVSILDPNRAIDNNYFSYTVVTSEGKILTGIVASETASSITLRQQENKSVTVLRQDIDTIKSNGVSLMPVGLEKNVKIQDMADLISFIKNWRYLDGRVPIEVGR